ncbi:hypothetical protein FS837_011301 [Tulasnella sp. UAMH 9824]|nr:hypothetical protein FS837_011301 [Tulasnella sp. UAMH 9824]
MGIPKFFRWISERYPLTSQLIEENKIPEFDNLYLDFNSIIHNCSHPNDNDAHFRLSEAQIFTAIFAYVDHLFSKIKPKKVFFMAVDGVAPRAKMNQQRSRRFRTAKEARETREQAIKRGEKLPEEKAFDSNCITPGTPFMARLSEQLKYFVNKKISEDADWRGIQVILSGHEVPGEGEHKIMEYIRLSKAQPDYNPNVRHCLYGLDADLIMLGLLSHDPHFCLLREEVKFGKERKKTTSLESQNFFLLHLSLLREYLDLEFHSLVELPPGQLSFDYSLERVIDDFILLAIFVGNDFLPHLPDFHIHENALEQLFEIYKAVLPKAGGYLVTQGTIDMRRLQLVMDELASLEEEAFLKESADQNYFKGKQAKHRDGHRGKPQSDLVLTNEQQAMFGKVKQFVLDQRDPATKKEGVDARVAFVNDFPARDRAFLVKIAADLNLTLTWDEYDEQDRNLATLYPPEPDADESEESEDEEAIAAVDRVLRKYERAGLIDRHDAEEFDAREKGRLQERMNAWKADYYRSKLEFQPGDAESVKTLVYRYCQGLQWVVYYYYSGVASWEWFYDYHYAPRISDFVGLPNMAFNFNLGEPFKPFEQLMGVLPEASKELVPEPFRYLMSNSESPILDFYPQDFEQDRNGKKNDWEAVVKIPFMDQNRLRAAMKPRLHLLTAEEQKRNTWGTSTLFTHTDEETEYPSSLPGVFPNIPRCHCAMRVFDLPTLDGLHLVEGLCDGVFLGVDALAGFPSLKTLPYTATLGYHSVNVFQAESRNKSMVLNIHDTWEGKSAQDIARELIGKRTFVNWPFLQEGLIVAVSDDMIRYEKDHMTPHPSLQVWKRKAEEVDYRYSKRFAVLTGDVQVVLHVRPLKGLKRLDNGSLVKEYEGPDKEAIQAVQMAVMKVISEDPRYLEQQARPLHEEYPEGSPVIFLGEHAYGVAARVTGSTEHSLSVTLAFFPSERADVETLVALINTHGLEERYYPAFRIAETLQMSGLALARIASNFMVVTDNGDKKNLGLRLKFDAKSQKVLGYSRKIGRQWEYSDQAIELIRDYKIAFPDLFDRLDDRGDDMLYASSIFPGNAEAKLREVEKWLKDNGVRDFEPVGLTVSQMSKSTIAEIEKFGNELNANRSPDGIKKAIVKGIPPSAVLKPSQAVYRLQGQVFNVGDRVTMVQDSGSVPITLKGVVVSLKPDAIDVVWDVPFMSGTTLGGRCSEYRGSTVNPNTCLNLTRRQFVVSTKPGANRNRPAQGVPNGQAPANAWVTAPPPVRMEGGRVQILSNPNRQQPGSRGSPAPDNGRASPASNRYGTNTPPAQFANGRNGTPGAPSPRGGHALPARGRGGASTPRGGRGGSPVVAAQGPLNHLLPTPPNQSHRGGRGFRGDRGGRGGPRGRGRGHASGQSTPDPVPSS